MEDVRLPDCTLSTRLHVRHAGWISLIVPALHRHVIRLMVNLMNHYPATMIEGQFLVDLYKYV